MSQSKKDSLFAEQFRQCCSITCGEAVASSLRNDSEYQALFEEYKNRYETLKQRMGEDSRPLMEYDDLKNTLAGLEDEAIYHQGFQDCVFLLRWIGLI